ncbi:MAG: FecR domain-containing protein [Flavihumibacter sp.]
MHRERIQPINTLLVPKGSQYELLLPDGTRVWLNAASSLQFPSQFGAAERRVVLNGEAYFEVKKDRSKPFFVMINDGSALKVLGTHFNISSYKEDAVVKTSLLEGAVSISKAGNQVILAPGQQAVTRELGPIRLNPSFNEEEVMAWREGKFQFTNAGIATVMNQVSRWYDVDITYQGTVSQKFNGTIVKGTPIEKIFEMLSLTNEVSFEKNNNHVIVKPAKK